MAVSLVLAAAAVLVLAGTGLGQVNDPNDPRNKQCGETAGGCNASKDCLTHHRGEGMYDAFVVVPIVPEQLKSGEEQTVQVQVVNPWKNHLGGVSVKANMKDAENGTGPILFVPGAASGSTEGQEPVEPFTWQGVYEEQLLIEQSDQPPLHLNFTVKPGVQAIVGYAVLDFEHKNPADPNGIDMRFLAPGLNAGERWEPPHEPLAPERNITMTGVDLRAAGTGNWSVQLEWDSNRPVPQNSVRYYIDVQVIYADVGGSATSYLTNEAPPPEDMLNEENLIPPGSSKVYDFPINSFAKGTQDLEIEVRAFTWYELGHQDGVTPNFDNYTRYATVKVVVGDEFVPSAQSVVTVKGPGEDLRLVVGEVTGFASAILLLPSLLLGGTFGKGSRKFFNNVLGGAKRRVMWHSLASLGITAAAVVHIIMFMLEIRYTLMMGMLWGGLGALSLLVLGLTGYYQVPLIQRHGYKWWRYTHLVFGILVVVFVSWHSIVDGPDFLFIREQIPEWLKSINLAEK